MAELTVDWPMFFGDLICYRYEPGTVHDGAMMYLGVCRHRRTRVGKHAYAVEEGLIDILDVGDPANLGHIEHQDPAMWQKCRHFARTVGMRVSGTFVGTFTAAGREAWLLGEDE